MEDSKVKIRSVNTTRFGVLEIEEDKIITFDEGIPGFEEQKQFFFFETVQSRPLVWMQSVSQAHIALPVISPFLVCSDYVLDIRDSEVLELNIGSESDIMVWTVAVVPADITKITANLTAPIIVNLRTKQGKQIIVDVKEYDSRFPIFEQLVKLLEGAQSDAGSVKED